MADDVLRALEVERAGYQRRGLSDRASQVDEQIKVVRGEVPEGRKSARAEVTAPAPKRTAKA